MKKLLVVIGIVLVTLGISSCVFELKIITWEGLDDKTIEVGDTFDPLEGVSATFSIHPVTDMTEHIEVTENPVDTNVPGEYTVKYKIAKEKLPEVRDASDEVVTVDNDFENSRKITVVSNRNESPVINNAEDQEILLGDFYNPRQNITATDFEDGDLTDSIIINESIDFNKAGDYDVQYVVTDSDGNETTVEITVTIYTDTSPILQGIENKSVFVGETYDLMIGVSASDIEDGDLTSEIETSHSIDVNVADDYTVIYSVEDSDGNITTEEIILTVKYDNDPVINNANDFTMSQGDQDAFVNQVQLVTATDQEDGNITNLLEYSGYVDINTPGNYTVILSITDSDGNTTTETINITVEYDGIDFSTISNVILRVTIGDDSFGDYPYDSLTGGFFADTNSVDNVDSSNKITEDLIYYEAVIWEGSGVVSLYQFTNEYNPNYENLPDVTSEMAFAYREQFLIMNFENMPRVTYDEVANEMVAIDFPENDPWNGVDTHTDQASTFLLNAFSAFADYLVTTHPTASHNLLYNGDDSFGGDLFSYNIHADDADQFLNNWTTNLGSNLGFIEMSGEINNKASVIDLVVFGPYTDYYIATDIYGTDYTFDDCNTNNCENVDWDATNVEYQYFNIFSQDITFQAMLEDRIDVTMYRYNISVNDITSSQNYQALYLYDTSAFLTFYNNLKSFSTDKDILLDEDLMYFLEQNDASQTLIDEYYSTILYEASTKTFFTWSEGYSGMILNYNILTFTAPSE